MLNRLSLILIATLAVLLVLTGRQILAGARPGDGPLSVGVEPPSANAAVLDPVKVSLPPLASLAETNARPLFLEQRRPPVDAEPAPVAAAPVSTGPGPNFSISAVVISEEERAVLVNHPETGRLVRVREGETIAGWKLEEVGPESAVFTSEGESKTAILRTFSAAPPQPAAPRGAAPGAAVRSVDPTRPRRHITRRNLRSRIEQGQ